VSDEKSTEIVSGLNPGEQVVTVGSYGLKDNQQVQIPSERRGASAAPGA
jgi:hypothetical protein